MERDNKHGPMIFFGKAVLMMELPRRHSTPPGGGRFAPIRTYEHDGSVRGWRNADGDSPYTRCRG